MNQITLDKVLDALKDEPISIGDRLLLLGLSKDEIKGKFSPDVLNTAVYGSSFLKFLQDNAKILADLDRGIPAQELPEKGHGKGKTRRAQEKKRKEGPAEALRVVAGQQPQILSLGDRLRKKA